MDRAEPTAADVQDTERAPSAEWREHEHLNEPARAAAERLLESAGTPEQAKHVIDVVHNQTPDHPTRHYDLASHAGFTSFRELVSASSRVREGDAWLVVSVPTGGWMAWHENSLEASEFESRAAAEEWIERGAGHP